MARVEDSNRDFPDAKMLDDWGAGILKGFWKVIGLSTRPLWSSEEANGFLKEVKLNEACDSSFLNLWFSLKSKRLLMGGLSSMPFPLSFFCC